MSNNDPSLFITGTDLDAAVKAGAITAPAAQDLVRFILTSRGLAKADDENFRLITGFNDIFVTIGLGLFFGAILYLTKSYFAYVMVPAAWVLAEVFTRRMRMALPSIVLLLVFVITIFAGVVSMFSVPPKFQGDWFGEPTPTGFVAGAAAALVGACLHWWRFHVPVTIAAGAAAAVGMIVATITYLSPDFIKTYNAYILFPLGVGVFSLAMYFDRQDLVRRTQLSDRAFWLHLLAAPLIVHPLVWNLAYGAGLNVTNAAVIILLFAVLSLVALVVDRRALLVSSLSYLGFALSTLFGRQAFGAEGSAVSILAVGVIVLSLSVLWRPLRGAIVASLPTKITDQIPPTIHS